MTDPVRSILKSIEDLRPAPYNPRKIGAKAAAALAKSLGDFGDLSGIVWNARTGNLVCGHQRVDQLRKLGGQLVGGALQIASGERFPVRVVDWPAAKEKTANVVANNPASGGEFNDNLADVLAEIKAAIGPEDFSSLVLDDLLDGIGTACAAWDPNGGAYGSLLERFGVPPFSVLDARQGYWRERKKAWLSVGIKSEMGRDNNVPDAKK